MADNSYDVIVVGAGFAGLTAARDLRQKGFGTLILEARDRIGGRSWYRRFADTDRYLEMGGGWADPECNPSLMQEIERYSIPLSPSPEDRTFFTILNGELIPRQCPVPRDQAAELNRVVAAIRHTASQIDRKRPIDSQGLDGLDISISEYFEQLSVPPEIAAIANGWNRLNSGAGEEEVSALHMLDWVTQLENDPAALAQLPTHVFAEGTASLLDALLLDGGSEIAYEAAVATVHHDDAGVEVVTEGGDVYTASAAVLAIPINCWSDLEFDPPLSADKAEIARVGQPGRSVKIWALAQNLPEKALAGLGERSAPIDVLSAEHRLPEGNLVVAFTTPERGIDASDPTSVERVLQAFVPEAKVAKVDSHDWNSDPYAKGTWFAGRPGYLSRYASAADATEGRVFFAGADVAHELRGWMTGAVRSGVVAAARTEQVLKDLD